jgi:hypothetical protein
MVSCPISNAPRLHSELAFSFFSESIWKTPCRRELRPCECKLASDSVPLLEALELQIVDCGAENLEIFPLFGRVEKVCGTLKATRSAVC